MQRLLVQSACEAFAAADISKSRSNSGTSSVNQSSSGTSNVRSKSIYLPKLEKIANLRRELFQHKRSSSLCSIPGGRCSPGMSRGKNVIRRSESTQFSRTLSPLLGEATFNNDSSNFYFCLDLFFKPF